MKWQQLVDLSDAELSRVDVAQVNLACAQGLPGTERIDFAACLRTLDAWIERIRRHTVAGAQRFRLGLNPYCDSWPVFKIMDMMTVLQRDLGAHYHQSLIMADDFSFFSHPEHLFVHGPLLGKGGTCASLPPLFVAVGRRLGYPLKLVHTFRHMYARWEHGSGERFNIECTSRGFNSHSDDHYRTWPHSLTEEEVSRYGALRSLTPRQELAYFLGQRGNCFRENSDLGFAVGAYGCACQLDPTNWGHSHSLVAAMNKWHLHINSRLMPGFPYLTIIFPPRKLPAIPEELERGMIHMQTKELLLNHPDFQREYWEPLRRRKPKKPLAHIQVTYPATLDGGPVRIALHNVVPPGFAHNTVKPC